MWLCTLTIFSHLQIITEVDGVSDDIVRPGSEVHVSDGTTRQRQTGNHLRQVVCCDTVAKARVDQNTLWDKTVSETSDSKLSLLTNGAMTIPQISDTI